MDKIFVVTHGNLATEFLKTAEMIVGQQGDILTFGLLPNTDLDFFYSALSEAVSEALSAEEEVLVLTDLFSGTPCNMVLQLSGTYKFQHITGINLPLFLEIVVNRNQGNLKNIDNLIKNSRNALHECHIYLEEGEG